MELARLRELLTGTLSAPAVCLIDGPGGVGKSALAVRAAHDVEDHFPDGLFYVDLRGADPHRAPLTTEEATLVLLTALGTGTEQVPGEPGAALRHYHARLSGRRTLLVLDNAKDSAQVAPLLPTGPGSAAVVTSRTVLTGVAQARHFHLETLSTPDAVALIKAVSGRPAAPDEQRDWEDLAGLCGRLPLALRMIATRLASRPRWSPADWSEVLRDERGRLEELVTSDLDARASLLLSIEQLAAGDEADRRAARLFPLLGTTAITTYSVPATAALSSRTPAEVRDALERLTDAQIASSPRPGTYALHDLVRAAAVSEAASLSASHRREALQGVARWHATRHRCRAARPGDRPATGSGHGQGRRRVDHGRARHTAGAGPVGALRAGGRRPRPGRGVRRGGRPGAGGGGRTAGRVAGAGRDRALPTGRGGRAASGHRTVRDGPAHAGLTRSRGLDGGQVAVEVSTADFNRASVVRMLRTW
ncbi:NB-ARC domain-containing protein [Streptomyces sp. GSL17-111]|uniref:NB-ARC domain-containing protein n=1 Tax=Streptomyces sp. GSL17-111 TaxID=3121596 RepID=UPI0030F41D0B